MTTKDFELIARVLADTYCTEDRLGVKAVAYRMADMLARTNDRFDRERFLRAAGVTTVAKNLEPVR